MLIQDSILTPGLVRDKMEYMPGQEVTLNELMEFLKENMVMNHDFENFKDEMYQFKDEMYQFKDEMYRFKDEMYGFRDEMYGFREEVYARFDRLESEIKDIKASLKALEQKTKEDDDVLLNEIIKLKQRVSIVEQKFKPTQ